jgi:hypothetical protein
MNALSSKYGFQFRKSNQFQFSPATHWTTGQQVTITFKAPVSCEAVKLTPYTTRSFRLHIEGEPWETAETLLRTSLGKDEIWEHLQSLRAIPYISQFVIWSGRQEITKNDKWPAGEIVAIPQAFAVTWEIENPAEPADLEQIIQEKMTPLISAMEAWQLLHNVQPRLFEGATLNYRGKLRLGLTNRAEVTRRTVEIAVQFEIIRKWTIKFIRQTIPNMATWAEIHTHFAEEDQRIPLFG